MSFSYSALVDARIIQSYVKDEVISCAGLGVNRILTNLTTNKRIVVIQYLLDCATPGNTVTWQDSDGVVKSGAMPFSATGGLVANESDVGQFMLEPGKHLDLNLSAAAQVSGHFVYALI